MPPARAETDVSTRRARVRGELLGDSGDPLCGKPGSAEREVAYEQSREGVRCLAASLRQNPGEKRLEYSGAKRATKPRGIPSLAHGGIVPSQMRERTHQCRRGPACQRDGIPTAHQAAAQRRDDRQRMPQRMPQLGHPVRRAHPHAHREAPERECVEIDAAPKCRVGRVEDLEPAVQPEAVDDVGALASADRIRGLEDDDVESVSGEQSRAAEPCEAGADHDHVMHSR